MRRNRFKRGRIYRRRRTAILLLFITLIMCIAILFFLSDADNGTNSTPLLTLITPSKSCPTPTTVTTKDHGPLPVTGSVKTSGKMDSLKNKVEDFIFGLNGKYGVCFFDLATGEHFGINERDSFVAASTSKLFINVMLYTKIESGEIDPESVLKYLEEDFEPGTGVIQLQPYGTEYTVRETSRLSIIHSDNCAINMIIRILGIEEICNYVLELGGEIYYKDGHRTASHDLGLVTKELYKLYLKRPEIYGELIYNLENTDWNDRIKAGIPKEVKVAHKIGNQVHVVNDVGIVFASHPFALAILTDDVDAEEAKNNIAIISKMIYDEVEAYVQ